MKIALLAVLIIFIETKAFEIGHEAIISTSWMVSDIAIGQKTQTMVEELLKEAKPDLLSQINTSATTVHAYAHNLMQIQTDRDGIIISVQLEKEIKDCLGESIFSNQEKLS